MGSPAYFKTGVMVVDPNQDVFGDLIREYRYGSFNYNQWRARDGILYRNYFQGRQVSIDQFMHNVHHFYGRVLRFLPFIWQFWGTLPAIFWIILDLGFELATGG